MLNFLMKGGGVNMFGKGICGIGDGFCAAFHQTIQRLLGLIYKVLGLFADLMHIAFYIFAGIDIKAGNNAYGTFDIEVVSTGARQNILDYFVFNEAVSKAYWILAGIGLLLIVIFTIYKIIKQDYFDKAGPRSKGPIFRNVAISAISFLLVIPIFYVIIHVSSLLAIAVMDAMGMDSSTFAGAQIFQLAWDDNGVAMRYVNNLLTAHANNQEWQGLCDFYGMTKEELMDEGIMAKTAVSGTGNFKSMYLLDTDTMFILMSPEPEYVNYAPGLLDALKVSSYDGGIITTAGENIGGATFYWYIYLVGVVVAIKALYQLLQAMLQRIFKIIGLFIVAPSPISQYVLDDGQKFKSWLAQSIQEGLRLVVATMSFSIFLMVLDLVGNINFITPFQSAFESASAENINVNASLLSYNEEFANIPMLDTAASKGDSGLESALYGLANAFMQIFVIMGASGAIIDLDAVLTPLISGGRSSLDAGQTGKAADGFVQASKQLAATAAGGLMGGLAGIPGGIKAGIDGRKAGKDKAEEELEKIEENTDKIDDKMTNEQERKNADKANGNNGNNNADDNEPKPDDLRSPDDEESAASPEGEGAEDASEGEEGAASEGEGTEGASEGEEGAASPEGEGAEDASEGEEGAASEGEGAEGASEGGEGSASEGEGTEGASEGGEGAASEGKGTEGGSDSKDGADKGSAKSPNEEGKGSEKSANKAAPKVSERLAEKRKSKQNKKLSQRIKRFANSGKKGAKLVGGVGKVFGAIGKAVGTTAKVAGKTLKTTARILGVKQFLRTAASMTFSAVVGKDTAKAFGDARAQGKKDAEVTKSEMFDWGTKGGYTKERKEQDKVAQEIADEKGADAQEAANNLVTKSNEQNEKADALNNANDEVAEAQIEANDANDAMNNVNVGGGSTPAPDGDVSTLNDEKAQAIAQKEKAITHQQVIAKKAGVSDLKELKASKDVINSQIKSIDAKAKKSGGLSEEDAKKRQELDNQRKEIGSYINQWEGHEKKIASADKTIAEKTQQIDAINNSKNTNEKQVKAAKNLISGKDGGLTKYGIKEDASYNDALGTLQTAAASGKAGAQEALENLQVAGENAYNSKEAKRARKANNDLSQKKETQKTARNNYNNAVKNTQQAREELKSSMQIYDNSIGMANKINDASSKSTLHTGNKVVNKTRYTGERDKDGNMVKKTEQILKSSNKKFTKESQQLQAENQEMHARADSAASIPLTSVKTYKDYEGWAQSRKSSSDEEYANAAKKFGTELTDNTNIIGVKTHANLSGVVDSRGIIDYDKLNNHYDKFGVGSEQYQDEVSRVEGIMSKSRQQAQNADSRSSFEADVMKLAKSAGRDGKTAVRNMLDDCRNDDGTYDMGKLSTYTDKERGPLGGANVYDPIRNRVSTFISTTKGNFAKLAKEGLNGVTKMTVGNYVKTKGREAFTADSSGHYDVSKINNQVKNDIVGNDGGIGESIKTYSQSGQKHTRVNSTIETGAQIVKAYEASRNNEVNQMRDATQRYGAVTQQVVELDKVIKSGSMKSSPESRKIIAETLGINEKDINANNAVQYATRAREAKYAEQVNIMKEGESHSKASQELKTELASMLNTITKGIGDKGANNNTTNITNVNNNNVNNNNQNPYWFDNNASKNEMPAASGLAQSKDMTSMYERMQVEGIKHMENMLEQMRREQKENTVDIRQLKQDVKDIKDDE